MGSMRCGGGGADLGGTVECLEGIGECVEVVGAVAGAVVAGAVVAAVAGLLAGRRRTVPRSGQLGKRAMWAVAGIVADVGLEIVQQLFS
jgi:hypothetical protein